MGQFTVDVNISPALAKKIKDDWTKQAREASAKIRSLKAKGKANANKNSLAAAANKASSEARSNAGQNEKESVNRNRTGEGGENYNKGAEHVIAQTEKSSSKFPLGSKVRVKHTPHTVVGHNGPMVHTTGGDFHHTKIVPA